MSAVVSLNHFSVSASLNALILAARRHHLGNTHAGLLVFALSGDVRRLPRRDEISKKLSEDRNSLILYLKGKMEYSHRCSCDRLTQLQQQTNKRGSELFFHSFVLSQIIAITEALKKVHQLSDV